jgi:hypothetical protein
MTQDPWGQPRPAGYVVRGEVVPDSESGAPGAGQAPPMTHFQKVASALRGDQHEAPADPEDEARAEEDEARAEEVRAVSSPDNGRDYWDDDEDGVDHGSADAPAASAADAPAASAAEDTAASAAEDTVASAGAPAADPETSPSATDGPAEDKQGDQAEDEPADLAGPDTRGVADPSMTQPDVFGAPRPTAASIPTVPISLADEPDGTEGRHAAPTAADVPTLPGIPAVSGVPATPAAAAPAAAPADTELRPGESGTTLARGESGYASLITDSADLRSQWHRIQYKFVDDPRASVSEAADVLAQVAARLEAAIAERQRGLRGRWDTTSAADTETLRETLRMYRTFLDQLIGPEPS